MKTFKENPTKAWNIVCAALILVLLVTQFLPFWHYGEPDQTVSISSFVWLLTDHDAVSGALSTATGENVTVNTVFAPAVLLMCFGIAGLALILWKSESGLIAAVPLLTGAMGFWQYLGKSAYRFGDGWVLHFALCAVLAVISAWRICAWAKQCTEAAKAKKAVGYTR